MTVKRSVGSLAWLLCLALPVTAPGADVVCESAREIPVACRVDVAVVGGSTGAVAAAVAAAESGARVFLAAPYPYLGDDMTATLRLWLEPGEVPASPLAERIFADPAAAAKPRANVPPPRPMHVKKVLDDALLKAKVQFLYSCYAADVLRDGAGNPCGIVMANRAGRQAVVARSIVDATDRGSVARMAGAKFRTYPTGMRTLHRVVIGGQPQSGAGVKARIVEPPFRGPFPNQAKTSSGEFAIIDYALRIPVRVDSCASWSAAEQEARTKTYHPEQQFTADALLEVSPDPVVALKGAQGDWPGAEQAPLEACRPAGVPRVYLLGGCADVPRPWVGKLLRPLALIDLGTRIGKAAADQARGLPDPTGVRLPGTRPANPLPGEVRESLSGVRPTENCPTVPQDARALPVLGKYDVVVVGGGTGGAPAGIAAARQGAKTLVVEYLHGLGGVGTLGAISSYYWGNRVGFSATVGGGNSWVIEQKAEWWRTRLLEAGAEIWFGTIGCGALVRDGRVIGAVVATPHGRGVVLAKVVIDATGNADLAAAAGAKTHYTDASEFGVQGTGLPGLKLGDTYNNTDFTIADETDMVDVWHVFVYAKNKYPQAFDQGRLIDTRERRRIVGDVTITLLDQINGRTYPDTVVRARSDFDSHGYTVDPYTLVEHPERKGFYVDVPYRAMLPAGLEGMLVTGLGISAHRDAVPLIRMQADIQNGGYAAGVAAASAARYDQPLRKVELRAVQAHLVEIGNLPQSVLTDKDSYPLPAGRIAQAVEELKTGKGAAAILAEPARALPLVKSAYAGATGKDKLTYGRMLAVLGDATGLETLLAEVERLDRWDEGWNYRGMGQYGNAFSPLDVEIVALGRARDRRALGAILKKLDLLTARSDFSHHRAVALALELIGDPAAARPLADLLARPGMSGHAHLSIEAALERQSPGGVNAVESRRESLRELVLARALYRCGDYQGRGKEILETYSRDLRGHLARHAQAVLKTESGK